MLGEPESEMDPGVISSESGKGDVEQMVSKRGRGKNKKQTSQASGWWMSWRHVAGLIHGMVFDTPLLSATRTGLDGWTLLADT